MRRSKERRLERRENGQRKRKEKKRMALNEPNLTKSKNSIHKS